MKNRVIINNYVIKFFESRESFLDQIADQKKILIAMNAEKILKKDIRLQRIINNNISYADGIGVVMLLRNRGFKAVKIPGSEFWLDIVNRFSENRSFYLIGSTNEVMNNCIAKLKKEYPHINIVGYRDGYLKGDDKHKLMKDLQYTKPDIVFVAQGSPKQEFLMEELNAIHSALYMGLGGSFDIYSGNKKRAPKFFLKYNLEWFYRLIKEPKRVTRQLVLFKIFFLLTNHVKNSTKRKEKRCEVNYYQN